MQHEKLEQDINKQQTYQASAEAIRMSHAYASHEKMFKSTPI
jgi:hypothetical protein